VLILAVVLVSLLVVHGNSTCTCLKRGGCCVIEIKKDNTPYKRGYIPSNCCCKAELLPKVSGCIIIVNINNYIYMLLYHLQCVTIVYQIHH